VLGCAPQLWKPFQGESHLFAPSWEALRWREVRLVRIRVAMPGVSRDVEQRFTS